MQVLLQIKEGYTPIEFLQRDGVCGRANASRFQAELRARRLRDLSINRASPAAMHPLPDPSTAPPSPTAPLPGQYSARSHPVRLTGRLFLS
ncbi:unnamed protein product, partial [Iphiclides podalirius]